MYPIDSTLATDTCNELSTPQNLISNNTNAKTTFSCSFPLEKVRTFLSKYTPFKDEKEVTKVSRRVLCLYCERTFVNINLREKHVERCHSSRHLRRASLRSQPNVNASCTYCDKFGTNERTLKDLFKHLVQSHPNKYFGCLICEIRFFNSRHLIDHNGLYHSSSPAVPSSDFSKNNLLKQPVRLTRKWKLRHEKAIVEEASVKNLRSKKALVKASRIIIKRSKRLQKKVNTFTKKHIAVGHEKKKYELKTNESKSLAFINPYLQFDHLFQVKKVTDHSIDSLRINSLTFDDVFDKAFFNRIKCNIEENLLHHIDGKLFKNEESESRISNFEKNLTLQEPQNIPHEMTGYEISLNALIPAFVSVSNQVGDDPETQIEYGSKAAKKKVQMKSDTVFYKYCTRRKYQASILERKENRDLSKLDIWTQCVIQSRQQKTAESKATNQECLGYVYGEDTRNTKRLEDLNRILDKRGPFEDLRQEAALEKRQKENTDDHMSEIAELIEDIFTRVFELAKETLPENSCDLFEKEERHSEITSYFNLRHNSSVTPDYEVDRSDRITLICSSQETEDLAVQNKNKKMELTGDWARPRIYVCAACGLKLLNIKQFLEHKSIAHQNIWVQHYEFVGNQSELYTHLSIPVLGKIGLLETTSPCKGWKRSEARLCTKCDKRCNSLGELHRHILECGGDWTWMLVRKKCKYKPFGARTRRKRRGLVKRLYTRKVEITEERKKLLKKSVDLPRQKPKPSDAETIKRMLANLPPKRITRKIINFNDNFNSSKNKKNLHAKRQFASRKLKENKKTKKKAEIPNNKNHRRSLRCLNKVLTNRIINDSSSIIKKTHYKSKVKNGSKKEPKKGKKINKTPSKNNLFKKKEKPEMVSRRCSLRIKKNSRFQGGTETVKRFFPVKKKNGDLEKVINCKNKEDSIEPELANDSPSPELNETIPETISEKEDVAPLTQINEVLPDNCELDLIEKVTSVENDGNAVQSNEQPASIFVAEPIKKRNVRKSRDLNRCIEMLASKLPFSTDNIDVIKAAEDFNVFQNYSISEPKEVEEFSEIAESDRTNVSEKTELEINETTNLDDNVQVDVRDDSDDEIPLAMFVAQKTLSINGEEELTSLDKPTDELDGKEINLVNSIEHNCDNSNNAIDILLTDEKDLVNSNKHEEALDNCITDSISVPLQGDQSTLGDQLENNITDSYNQVTEIKTNLIQSESMSSIKENVENNIIPDVNSIKFDDTAKEVRRSLRNCKRVTSYNESDLTAPLLDDFETKKAISKIMRLTSDEGKLRNRHKKSAVIKSPSKNEESNIIPKSTMITTFTDDFKDDNYESFENILEKSIAIVDENIADDKEPSTVVQEVEDLYSFDSPKDLDLVLEKQNERLTLKKIDLNGEQTVTSEASVEIPKSKDIYCDICEKSFKRTEGLIKHKRTLTHISKLSELEAKEAALKQAKTPESILESVETILEPPSEPFEPTETVKLVDIISDVLHRPNLEKNDNLQTFYDYFGTNESVPNETCSDSKELDYNLKTRPPTLLENQISLLENIIENHAIVRQTDELSLSSVESPIRDNDLRSDSDHSNLDLVISEPNPIDDQRCANQSNIDHYFTHNYDACDVQNFDEQKARKRLNRDEELFLECCSLLKSASEISSFSLTKDLNKSEAKSFNVASTNGEFFENSPENSISFNGENTTRHSTNESNPNKWQIQESYSPVPAVCKIEKQHFERDVLSFEKIFQNDDEVLDNGESVIDVRGELPKEETRTSEERVKQRKKRKRVPKDPVKNGKNVKKVLTKGAMKTFEGLKVSIPTEDLNINNILAPTPPVRRELDDDDEMVSKINEPAKQFEQEEKFSCGSSPDMKLKQYDIYDFEETQDNSELFNNHDFRSFRHGARLTDKTDSINEESQNYSNTADAFSSSTSSRSEIFPKRRKDRQNITKKKCMIMGRIFKNALKSKVGDEESRSVPLIRNGDLVEDFMVIDRVKNRGRMTTEEMNVAFDKLINSCYNQESQESTKTDTSNLAQHKNIFKRKQRSKLKKKSCDMSGSSDEEFKLNSNSKKRVKKQNNSESNCINLEQELRECIGVASRKSQRKCTTGKQNVLIEYWSSDESNLETVFETNVDTLIKNYKKSITKKRRRTVPLQYNTVNRRKRAAANPLYHWSSSSEDDAQDLIEIRPVRDEFDDDNDEDRPMQHGWIVGDSPKKLVTMLAHAKGKKSSEGETVKEQGKKQRPISLS